jgi:hypothetical protein
MTEMDRSRPGLPTVGQRTDPVAGVAYTGGRRSVIGASADRREGSVDANGAIPASPALAAATWQCWTFNPGASHKKDFMHHDLTQPLTKLTTANAALIANFAQSPEMTELATASAQKYFELAKKSFGPIDASSAQADLVRRLTENYSTFAQEYSASLIGMATEAHGQIAQQVQAAADQMTKVAKSTVAAASAATKTDKPSHSR